MNTPTSRILDQTGLLHRALESGNREDAIKAIDAALAELDQVRSRLLAEIAAYDAQQLAADGPVEVARGEVREP